MLDNDAAVETNASDHEPPPFRDRLPTIPHDLSEYALAETGPSSWSAERDAAAPLPWASEEDPFRDMTTGHLLDVRPGDVPYIALTTRELTARMLDAREAFVVSLLDGTSTLDALLDAAELQEPELLAIVCDLCARGIITLQRMS
jgi:hypothetical protein